MRILVFFHGYGSNGRDYGIQTLISELKTKLDRQMIGLAPDAPFVVNGVSDGKQWFPIDVLDEDYLFRGIQNVYPIVAKYLTETLQKYNAKYEDLILAGFSQGAALALHTALKLDDAIRCVIGFSGGFANPGNIMLPDMQKKSHNVCLIHGNQDGILPHAFSLQAYKSMRQHIPNCKLHIVEDLDHAISDECIEHAVNFMKLL